MTVIILRTLAVGLLIVNLYMCMTYFSWHTMLIYFTNWTLEITIIFVLYLIYCASYGDQIQLHKKKLACLHLLYEVAFALNLVTVLGYWGLMHDKAVLIFEGP